MANFIRGIPKERGDLTRLDRTPVPPDFEAPATAVESRVRHFRIAFEESPDPARGALPPAGESMRVSGDPEYGFRVEGLLRGATTSEPSEAEAAGRFACVVAGGGFEPPTSGL